MLFDAFDRPVGQAERLSLVTPRWVMRELLSRQAAAPRQAPVVLYGPDNRPIDRPVTVDGAAVGQTVSIRQPQRYRT
jgi:hypothetical protein